MMFDALKVIISPHRWHHYRGDLSLRNMVVVRPTDTSTTSTRLKEFANLRDDPLPIRMHAPNMEKSIVVQPEFYNKEVNYMILLLLVLGNFTKPDINITHQHL